MNPDYPRWLRLTVYILTGIGKSIMAVLKHWKETIGSAGIIYTIVLWYRDDITQEKAIFGVVLLVAGGFINTTIDLIGLFKYLGNYKKGGENEPA